MADTEPTPASTDVVPEDMDPGPASAATTSQDGSTPDSNPALEAEAAGGDDLDAMEVQPDAADDGGDDMLLEEGDNTLGKRVKVRCRVRRLLLTVTGVRTARSSMV